MAEKSLVLSLMVLMAAYLNRQYCLPNGLMNFQKFHKSLVRPHSVVNRLRLKSFRKERFFRSFGAYIFWRILDAQFYNLVMPMR